MARMPDSRELFPQHLKPRPRRRQVRQAPAPGGHLSGRDAVRSHHRARRAVRRQQRPGSELVRPQRRRRAGPARDRRVQPRAGRAGGVGVGGQAAGRAGGSSGPTREAVHGGRVWHGHVHPARHDPGGFHGWPLMGFPQLFRSGKGARSHRPVPIGPLPSSNLAAPPSPPHFVNPCCTVQGDKTLLAFSS